MVGEKRLNRYIELLSKHSSVTIVTNGIITMKNISLELACFGVPLHGDNAQTHEWHNQHPGSFAKTLRAIEYYVKQGHDVRCVPVLTNRNFDQIYGIIKLANDLGMESIFVDRYEDGGIGAVNDANEPLKPNLDQFRTALDQMLKAREDFPSFGNRIGFGTAIPFCLDPRMIQLNMTSDCGVGSTFAAINPQGEFRICNQSQLSFGNVLEESITTIWQKPEMDIFRDLSWVTEPCRSCPLLLQCTGGCKVDVNCSDTFCIDFAVRGLSNPLNSAKTVTKPKPEIFVPAKYRNFKPNRFAKLNLRYGQKFLVTRYQTVKLNQLAITLVKEILTGNISSESQLIEKFSPVAEIAELRKTLSQLVLADAVDLI